MTHLRTFRGAAAPAAFRVGSIAAKRVGAKTVFAAARLIAPVLCSAHLCRRPGSGFGVQIGHGRDQSSPCDWLLAQVGVFDSRRYLPAILSIGIALGSSVLFCLDAHAQEQSAAEHNAPPAPQTVMPPMSDTQMSTAMEMDDNAKFAMFKLDEFERGFGKDADATRLNAQAWYGGDFDKFWLRTEGEREAGVTDARIEAFWDHAFASYWDWQVGARRDIGDAPGMHRPGRNWAAFGVQGLAPYWFEIEATAYVAASGHSAARFRAEYELLLTQKLILAPELELNFYSKSDRVRDVAAGLSGAEFGLRLRYEIRREFAPYAGVVWNHRHTNMNGVLAAFGNSDADCQFVIGLRIWL
jgi:copper resistance protein B